MDLLDDDMGRLLIFYYTLSGLLRTDIEFSMIFLLIGYIAPYISSSATNKIMNLSLNLKIALTINGINSPRLFL